MEKYPECEKFKKISKESQIIGEFLEWLEKSNIVLCQFNEDNQEFYQIFKGIQNLLAKYFKIDLKEVEKEQRAMLKDLQLMAIKEKK